LNTFKNELINKAYEEIEKFLTSTLDSKLTIYSANGFILVMNSILTELDNKLSDSCSEESTETNFENKN
jgi:predicted house-cleaning noncanonical NTP pyrophosphatase (MazG superfamily)